MAVTAPGVDGEVSALDAAGDGGIVAPDAVGVTDVPAVVAVVARAAGTLAETSYSSGSMMQ